MWTQQIIFKYTNTYMDATTDVEKREKRSLI